MKNDGIQQLVVCRRVKKLARDKGYSKAKLARDTGLSAMTIWSIFSERVRIQEATAAKLAKALGVSTEYILHGKDDAPALAVLEGPGKKYGSAGLTMADAIKMISEQLGVPEDAVREKISELLRSDEGPKKRKG